MLSKDILSYTHVSALPIIAATSTYPQSVSAVVMQDDEGIIQCTKSEQASCDIGHQGVASSALPSPDRLQVDNGARSDTPPPSTSSNKSLDAVTRTSSTHSSGCPDLTSPPSILVTLSVHGDDRGQVGSASSSKDDDDSVTTSTGDIPLCASNASSHDTSASSLRTLTDTHSSVTLLNSTSVVPPRRLFKGSSLRISRTYNDSTEDSVDPPLSDHLCVPSLDIRVHSAPPSSATRKSLSTQASPGVMSWLTDKSYGITPPFTRRGINAPGVVLPLTVREYQWQQHLKEFEQMRKEDVDGARRLSFVVPCSIDSCHGTVQPTTCGIRARSPNGNTLVLMDSPSFPRIFGNRTEINQRLTEEVHVPAAQPLRQQYGCTCEAGRSCLCCRTINRRDVKIRRKNSKEGPGAESRNRRTATSVLMKIVSKFNRGTGSTG